MRTSKMGEKRSRAESARFPRFFGRKRAFRRAQDDGFRRGGRRKGGAPWEVFLIAQGWADQALRWKLDTPSSSEGEPSGRRISKP